MVRVRAAAPKGNAMNMMSPIEVPQAKLERRETAATIEAKAIAADRAASSLDREERVAILLSRRSSRLAALAGSWGRIPAAQRPEAGFGPSRSKLAALRRFAILYRLDGGGLAFEEEERLARFG